MAPCNDPSTSRKQHSSASYADHTAELTRAAPMPATTNADDTVDFEVIGDPEIPVMPRNPQACLGGVPEEIVLSIFEQLREENSVDALAKLCRTDNRCKRIAEALLYSKIKDNQAMHSMVVNRELAKHVQSLKLWFASDEDRLELSLALQNAINVQRVEIMDDNLLDRGSDIHSYLIWPQVFSKSGSPVGPTCWNPFSNLRVLRIRTFGAKIEGLQALFRIPSLERLSLNKCVQVKPFRNWHVPEKSCNIKDFRLFHSFLDVDAVAQIIRTMKALKRFKYCYDDELWEPFGADENPLSYRPRHSWVELGDALRSQKHSLECFHVGNTEDEGVTAAYYPAGRNQGSLGSFRDFAELDEVAAPLDAFLNMKAGEYDLSRYLPPQLITFHTDVAVIPRASVYDFVPMIRSLQGVLVSGASIHLAIDELLPFKQIGLFKPLAAMVRAGFTLYLTKLRDFEPIGLRDLQKWESRSERYGSDDEDMSDDIEMYYSDDMPESDDIDYEDA